MCCSIHTLDDVFCIYSCTLLYFPFYNVLFFCMKLHRSLGMSCAYATTLLNLPTTTSAANVSTTPHHTILISYNILYIDRPYSLVSWRSLTPQRQHSHLVSTKLCTILIVHSFTLHFKSQLFVWSQQTLLCVICRFMKVVVMASLSMVCN